MTNYLVSLIRTWVPIAVGTALSFLAVQFGLVVDDNLALQLTTVLTGLTIAVYYAVVRLAERKFPQVGILLGSTQKPVYVEPTAKSAQK